MDEPELLLEEEPDERKLEDDELLEERILDDERLVDLLLFVELPVLPTEELLLLRLVLVLTLVLVLLLEPDIEALLLLVLSPLDTVPVLLFEGRLLSSMREFTAEVGLL